MSIERGFVNKNVSGMYRKVLYAEEKYLCKYVDSFIFVSEGLKEFYVKTCSIDTNNILVSPTGINVKDFKRIKSNIRQTYGVKDNEILLGVVGGIAKVRKITELIVIFSKVVQQNKNVKLMFVGEGDALQDLKDAVKKEGLESNVIFVGNIPHKEIQKYYSSFDLSVCHLPNIFIYENSVPFKVIESLACGVPVLCSELKAHYELSQSLDGIYVYKKEEDILKQVNKKPKEVNANLKRFDWGSISLNYKNIWMDVAHE